MNEWVRFRSNTERTYLARSIDDFGRKVLISIANRFAEGILNRGVVAVDEMSVHKLNCQRRLAYIASYTIHG